MYLKFKQVCFEFASKRQFFAKPLDRSVTPRLEFSFCASKPSVDPTMAGLILRSACRRALLQSQNVASPMLAARTVVLKTVQADNRPGESHDDRNARLQRPQSPHLTIYSFQLTAVLSITHRMTGMALAGYATALGLGALAMPHDATHYLTMLEGLSAPTLMALKFTMAYPFSYPHRSRRALRHPVLGSCARPATRADTAGARCRRAGSGRAAPPGRPRGRDTR
ncbi:hypothetical protein pipiens_007850 [Culex pipiens pipiens]|uniref:Succinate dehydrogenase cytochrome b560 subunit, mitochondrial n=1 Tax=Culex pipiens pipiens TaxID=38569 RepID=A0ABD1DJK5_CULPP